MSRKPKNGLLFLALAITLPVLSGWPSAYATETKIEMASVFAARVPVMLQFGKSWCPRCKSSKPILDSVARAYAGKALVIPVDVEVNKGLVRDFSIRLIPTQIFLLPDRTQFFRHEGILQEHQIRDVFGRMGVQ
ncbi:MAG: thioredoxin family protein [Deltaproteobacteria bacterium]|nr:thioredoxin family protein [Deltaproteobacteria bacterium]